MGAYSNFGSFWQNLTEKILNLAIFRQEKCLKSPKLNIFLVRLCQKVPIIYKICMVGAYSRWALIQARTVPRFISLWSVDLDIMCRIIGE